MEEKALRKREQKLRKRSNEKLHGLGELNGSHELCGLKRTLITQRREQGITLIALVVTIIILIILATVAINFAFGSNGLIKRAEDARDYYSNDTAYTDESMANVESYLDELIGSTNAENTLVQALKDGRIAVGDYVSYTPDAHDPVTVGTSETGYTNQDGDGTATNQTFSQNANTTWRVLGLSEDGEHVLLTTGSPIKRDGDDPYLVLESAAGAANCVTVLNKISGLYHNSTLAEETRSMTIEDIENVLGDMTVQLPTDAGHDGKVYFTDDESQTPIGETTYYPSYTYREGDYTLTNPPQRATAGQSIDGDAWMFLYTTTPEEETRAEYVPERVWDMLFAGTTGSSDYAKSYWLASPGVGAYSGIAYFGPGAVGRGGASSGAGGLFGSYGYWYARGYAVRPVVVLKSNVTIDQVPKIEDQEEDPWTGYSGGEMYYNGRL